jgi:hypothetical protein
MANDPNVDAVQNLPVFGKFIYLAFQKVQKQLTNISLQANVSLASSQNEPPPQVNALSVTASGGVAHVQVTDNNQNIYRGIHYHVQYAADPGFANPITFHMGPSRDARIPVGTQPLYWRAFSDYPTSAPSIPVYHGGSTPQAIAAIGTEQPAIPAGMGSGTGTSTQISGFGPIPWRGANPPKRA